MNEAEANGNAIRAMVDAKVREFEVAEKVRAPRCNAHGVEWCGDCQGEALRAAIGPP